MTSIISLPTEILHNIFNHLDKIKDIAACRLVCQAWDTPAEHSMFEYGVTLADNRMGAMQALHHVLVKNPEKGNWIKRLTLDLPYNQHPLVMSRLLLLALTPSITTISGDIGDRTLLRRMVDKIQHSEQKFDRLKELTVRPFLFGTPHHDLALSLCKDTLEKLKLDGTTDLDFLPALDQFTRLTSLMLYLPNATMTTLSMVLDKCPHVQDLNLTLEWRSDTVLRWDQQQQQVNKHTNMKSLDISAYPWSDDILAYLLCRMNRLTKISILHFIVDNLNYHALRGVPTMIKEVAEKEIIYHVALDGADEEGIMELLDVYKKMTIEKIGSEGGYATFKVTL